MREADYNNFEFTLRLHFLNIIYPSRSPQNYILHRYMRIHSLQIQVSLAKVSNIKGDAPARKGLLQSRVTACVHSVDLWYPIFHKQ